MRHSNRRAWWGRLGGGLALGLVACKDDPAGPAEPPLAPTASASATSASTAELARCPAFPCQVHASRTAKRPPPASFEQQLSWFDWSPLPFPDDRSAIFAERWAQAIGKVSPESELARALLTLSEVPRLQRRHLTEIVPQWLEARRWIRRAFQADAVSDAQLHLVQANRNTLKIPDADVDDTITATWLNGALLVKVHQSRIAMTFWLALDEKCEKSGSGHLGAALLGARDLLALPYDVCSPPGTWNKLVDTPELVYAELEVKHRRDWYDTMMVASDGRDAAITFLKVNPRLVVGAPKRGKDGKRAPRPRAVWFPPAPPKASLE